MTPTNRDEPEKMSQTKVGGGGRGKRKHARSSGSGGSGAGFGGSSSGSACDYERNGEIGFNTRVARGVHSRCILQRSTNDVSSFSREDALSP